MGQVGLGDRMVGVVEVIGVVCLLVLNKKPALKVARLTEAPQKISASLNTSQSYQVAKFVLKQTDTRTTDIRHVELS